MAAGYSKGGNNILDHFDTEARSKEARLSNIVRVTRVHMVNMLGASRKTMKDEEGRNRRGRAIGACKDLIMRAQRVSMEELDRMIAFCS